MRRRYQIFAIEIDIEEGSVSVVDRAGRIHKVQIHSECCKLISDKLESVFDRSNDRQKLA